MGTKNVTLLGVVCLLVFSSCSLQKRLYNKGFYASMHHAAKKTEQKTDRDTSATLLGAIKSADKKEQNKNSTVVAINNSKSSTTFLLPNTKLIGDCDTLVLTNGTKILVKVREVNPNQIKFKYCSTPDEPIRELNKKDISYIVYANGYKEVVNEYKPTETNVQYQQPQILRTNGFAVAGFVLSLVNIFITLIVSIIAVASAALSSAATGVASSVAFTPFFFPFLIALLSILFCIVSIVQIHKNRDSQQGLAFSIIGLVISTILLVILIAIITALM